MKVNIEGEIERIGQLLDISVSADQVSAVAEAVSFSNAIKKPEPDQPVTVNDESRGFAQKPLFKGTNGRWQGDVRDDQIPGLDPGLRWLEQGRAALGL